MMVTRNSLWGLMSVLATAGCSGMSFEQGAGGSGGEVDGGKDVEPKPPGSPKSPRAGSDAGGTGAHDPEMGGSESGGSESGGSESSGGGPGPEGGTGPSAYPGEGFIVHEWGTDTIVVGSDGSLQRGLQHEEEDLPAFVYDRLKAGPLLGKEPSVTIKMETPVTYFYSDEPLTVEASVQFPKGVLTQWFPAVTSFLPGIAAPGAITPEAGPISYADPALDSSFPFMNDLCREKFSALHDGRLDWGSFSVLGPGADAAVVPPAALDEFTWSYARNVASNALVMPNGESEKFLFYRGLGEFELPVSARTGAGGKVTLKNDYSEAIPTVFIVNVDAERGAFVEHASGIARGGVLEGMAPDLAQGVGVDDYVEQLASRVTAGLDASGLYHDEAVAMVSTWKRQWFRTPGLRLLYLIPQSWTEASIPLSVSPKPDHTLRVMLIRVELITPEQEAVDVEAVKVFDSAPDVAAAHFHGLGRFEEPRLRRALSLSQSVAGSQYLASIQSKALAALGE
jgi:hypothetical protein